VAHTYDAPGRPRSAGGARRVLAAGWRAAGASGGGRGDERGRLVGSVDGGCRRTRDTWLTAERIAAECGLPLERVQAVLDGTSGDVIFTPADEPGRPPRYSTRAHYRATSSILRRYLDVLTRA
jgi:hypothetical protein